jgi:hypothetical protein
MPDHTEHWSFRSGIADYNRNQPQNRSRVIISQRRNVGAEVALLRRRGSCKWHPGVGTCSSHFPIGPKVALVAPHSFNVSLTMKANDNLSIRSNAPSFTLVSSFQMTRRHQSVPLRLPLSPTPSRRVEVLEIIEQALRIIDSDNFHDDDQAPNTGSERQ